jgi:uncharacterized protein YciI
VYAIALIRYRKQLDDVLKVIDEHRAYLKDLKAKGTLLASGPLEPRYGGALLLRIPDGGDADAALNAVRDGDPFVKRGIAQYELLPWMANIGKEDLDRL